MTKNSKLSVRLAAPSLGVVLAALAAPSCAAEPEAPGEQREALACVAQVDADWVTRQSVYSLASSMARGAPAPSPAELAGLPPASSIVPPTCSCATVTIHCQDSLLPPNVAGQCYQPTCTMNLSASSCALFNLHEGSVVDPRSLLGYDDPPPPPQDPDDYCTVKHEARHACDQPIAMSACETEESAYMTDYACLKNRFDASCSPFPAQSGALFGYCSRVREEIQGVLAAAEFNHCICRSDTTCGQCVSACNWRKPQVEICTLLGATYCGNQNGEPPSVE